MEEPIQELAPRISDCLKVIYAMQERGQKVTTSAVSEHLCVSDATVTMLFKDFAAAGWVEHTPYRGVTLTPLGERKAMEVIRHHRLLELYLARELGLYPETRVELVARAPFGGPLHIRVGEKSQQVEHMLGPELAEHIIVTPIETGELAN